MKKVIAHRELRNNSSAVLREVQRGTTFEITNHGKVVAVLGPPEPDVLAGFTVRRARIVAGFDEIERISVDVSSQQILDELRGDR